MSHGMGIFQQVYKSLFFPIHLILDSASFILIQARPLLDEYAIDELVDPRLGNQYSEHEVYCMLHAASMCIRRDPHTRPRMSQVKNAWFRGATIKI